MREYSLSRKARGDLDGIRDYTIEKWGPEQAYVYIRILGGAFERITEDPTVGKDRPEIMNGLMSLVVGRHVVFYVMDEKKIQIVRILHQRMDPSVHF